MKKVMAEMYQTLDGMLFDSPSVARQYEIDLFNAGTRVVEAQVTRKVAKLYALYLMNESGAPFLGKECWHFGRCEVELLLDLVYGHRGDGAPVDVKDLLGEIRG